MCPVSGDSNKRFLCPLVFVVPSSNKDYDFVL